MAVQHLCISLVSLLKIPIVLVLLLTCPLSSAAMDIPGSTHADAVFLERKQEIQQRLEAEGLSLGNEILLRIFKIPGKLEVWVKKSREYVLFTSHPICRYSGYPGPKTREGDWQSPEGIYQVRAEHLHPHSSYHLAFNIGYPNQYDTLNGRSGSHIMVHGGCSSTGCFAMGDKRIEEVYLLLHQSLANGQPQVPVHIFPFPLTQANLTAYAKSPWIEFWRSLAPIYRFFETNRTLPDVAVTLEGYALNSSPSANTQP